MKKSFLYLFTVLCTLNMFTACSDDDDSKDPNGLEVNATYSGENLDLKYSDVALLGKEISFETKDGKTATLTMKGTFDMSVINGLINGGSKSALIPNLVPGVIPGEITTTISNVPLTLSGEKYTFEGTDSGNGREVKYTGSVKKDKLVLSLNVTMPKNDLTGNWKLAAQQPLNLVWSAGDATIDLSGLGISGISGPIPVSMAAPMIGQFAGPMLHQVLKSISYGEDGNITARYMKKGASDWQSSPLNLAQYYIKNNKLYVQLNIAQILATVEANKSKADIGSSEILKFLEAIKLIAPYLSDGVPLSYSVSNGTAQVTLGYDVLGKLFALLTDEDLSGLILGKLPDNFKAVMAQIPGILEKTDDVNVTLILQKQ